MEKSITKYDYGLPENMSAIASSDLNTMPAEIGTLTSFETRIVQAFRQE
jgi:hypothetical protein